MRSMRCGGPTTRLGLFALSLVLLWTARGVAQHDGSRREEACAPDNPSRWLSEVDVAYGRGLDLSSGATTMGDVRVLGVLPRFGRELGRRFGRDSWREGQVELLLELPALVSREPEDGHALGVSLLGRYVFVTPDRFRPFVGIGAGPLYLDFNNEENQSDGLSFTLQGSAGVRIDVAPGWAILSRALFHHISNAGLRKPNPGINSVLMTIGITRRGP